jgi:hypothetical protein
MFSIAPVMTDGQVEEDTLLASTLATFESSGFLPVGHLKPLYMQLLLTTKRHFTIALWAPVRLSATTPAALNGCGGP